MPIFKSNNKPKNHHDSSVHPSDQTSIIKNSTKLGKLKSLVIKHKLIAIGLSTLTTAMITTAIALPIVYTTGNLLSFINVDKPIEVLLIKWYEMILTDKKSTKMNFS